jgi:hypothetical protein
MIPPVKLHRAWDRAKLEAASAAEGMPITLSFNNIFAIDCAMEFLRLKIDEDETSGRQSTIHALWGVWQDAGGVGKGIHWNKSRKERPRALTAFVRECFRQADLSEQAPKEGTVQAYLEPRWRIRRYEQNKKRRKSSDS